MDVKAEWYEELPDQCPPAEAFIVDGFVCYRLCKSEIPSDSDFYSHRKLYPEKKFSASECETRSISVFRDPVDLDRVLKLAVHKGKAVVSLTLSKNDGVAMKTGKDSHYSWWRSIGFKVPGVVGDSA